ncbi:MAG TPA: hypothetical protein VEA19_02560, partial [Actinomycetota bacterium]|nr:hypothetical protein [Actinomycetota bacterium]
TEDQLLGYVCDGASKWDWLSGPRTGNHFELASDKGTVLTGTIGDRIQGALTWRAGAPVSFVLDEASGISGLFRMPDFPEPGFVAGWIVAKGFGLRGVSAGEEGGIKGGLAVDEPPTGQPAGETPPPGTGGAGTDEVPLESCAQIGDLIDLLVAAMAGKTVDTEGKPIQPTKLMLNGMRRQLEEAMHKYNQQDC